jgi:hypothetical protein
VAALKWENSPARLARRVSAEGNHLPFAHIVMFWTALADSKGPQGRVTESQEESDDFLRGITRDETVVSRNRLGGPEVAEGKLKR